MNVQHWAVLFVAILSCNYASGFFFGHYKGVGRGYDDDNTGYYGWSRGCSCHGRLSTRLDNVLNRIRTKVEGSYDLLPQSLEEYELKEGRCSGLNKFERKGPYRCSVTRDYARIIFNIGFSNCIINYKLSFLNNIRSGFMGGFASIIARFFGRIVDFVFKVSVHDLHASVIFRQDFGADGGLYMEGFYPTHVGELNFLDGKFGRHSKSITPYLRPVFDHVLRYFFHSELKNIFSSSFKTVVVDRSMFSYKHGGHNKYWSGYGGDSSTSGDWDGSTSNTDSDSDSESYRTTYTDSDSDTESYRTTYTDSDSDTETYTYTYEVEDDDSE